MKRGYHERGGTSIGGGFFHSLKTVLWDQNLYDMIHAEGQSAANLFGQIL